MVKTEGRYASQLFWLLENRKYSEFADLAARLPAASVAEFISELDGDGAIFAFRLLSAGTAASVLPYLNSEHREELSEGMMEKPYLRESPARLARRRLPWLLGLMLSSTLTGIIISSFESALSAVIILTAFIPMIMGTGGNAGAQVCATVTRALSLGELSPRDALRVVTKELCTSFLCGAALAAANFIKICVFDMAVLKSDGVSVAVAAAVSLTLFITVICAKLAGSILPLLASRLGLDPAVAAGPAVTTVVDVISLLSYFAAARVILNV